MKFNFDLILKKTGKTHWTLLSQKGVTLYVFTQCRNRQDAEYRAKAWASSWESVNITVVEDEQDKNKSK